MNDICWQSVYDVFKQIESTSGKTSKITGLTDNGTEPNADKIEVPTTQSLVKIRSKVREQLDKLKVKLSNRFTEGESYYVLFPIVVHIDEYVQTKYLKHTSPLNGTNPTWPTLQKELFEIEDGGILFYESIDALLKKPQTPPFVLEVYLLCLNHGFTGRYNENILQISEYKKKLIQRIPVKKLDESDMSAALQEPVKLKKIIPPVCYYALAIIVVYCLHVLISGTAILYGSGVYSYTASNKDNDIHSSLTSTNNSSTETVESSSTAGKITTAANYNAQLNDPEDSYIVQYGPLLDYDTALTTCKDLKSKGYAVTIHEHEGIGRNMHAINIGTEIPLSDAKRLCNDLSVAKGIRCIAVKVK
jgi:type IV/VI secretion system ImpK/VasF family protein